MRQFSPRLIRIVYTLLAAFVFAVGTVNFYHVMVVNAVTNDMCQWEQAKNKTGKYVITRVIEAGVAEKAGIRVGDTLVSINGVRIDAKQPGVFINAYKAGEMMIYRLKRGDSVYSTHVEVVKSINLAYLALYMLGLGFLFVGWAVLMAKPQGEIQRRFGRLSIISMAYFSTYIASISLPFSWGEWVLLGMILLAHIEAPVQFVSFFCHFPVRKRITEKRWFIPAMYIISIALTSSAVGLVFGWPITGKLASILYMQIAVSPMYFYTIGLTLFANSYFRRIEREARSQLRHILYAVFMGGASYAYILILSNTDPLAFVFYPVLVLPAFLIVGVPLAFGYAIVRYRLMDVDFIVKRSLIYGTVTAIVAVVYLLVVIGIGNIISNLFGEAENEVMTIVAIVVIAFLFDPIKRMAQEWIDKLFYQDRYNYQKALLEFSRELPRHVDLEHILSSIVSRISNTMHVEKAAVLLCHEQEGCRDASMNMDMQQLRFSMEDDGLAAYLRSGKSALSLAIPEEEFNGLPILAADKELLKNNGVVLVVPMLYKEELLGTFLVGQKLSGKLFSQEDIDLLSTVASQAAIAIENARLYKAELERNKIQEELNIARRIQLGLLPQGDPHFPGLDISGISIPAQSVGGDYFDYITLEPGKLLVVVADVSGKGIPAALYMSKVQGMIRIAAGIHRSPREILIHVNKYIHERLERSSFVTIALALFDLERRSVTICRAGHTKPILKAHGRLEYITPRGMGLGLEEGPAFTEALEEVTYPLTADDLVVLYSDGLTESMDSRMEEFGEERLFQSIDDRPSVDARSLKDEILRRARQFSDSAAQHDDMTLVVVKVNNGAAHTGAHGS